MNNKKVTPQASPTKLALARETALDLPPSGRQKDKNESMLRKWMQQTQEAQGDGRRAFPGHGRPRDEELARLRKEVKALREASD